MSRLVAMALAPNGAGLGGGGGSCVKCHIATCTGPQWAAASPRPLYWRSRLDWHGTDSATDWHRNALNSISALRRKDGPRLGRNYALGAIGLVLTKPDGSQLAVTEDLPTLFVSGSPLAPTEPRLALLAQRCVPRGFTFAYDDPDSARTRAGRLLEGVTEACVAPPHTPETLSTHLSGICSDAVGVLCSHSEQRLLDFDDPDLVTRLLVKALRDTRAVRGATIEAITLDVATYKDACNACGLCFRAAVAPTAQSIVARCYAAVAANGAVGPGGCLSLPATVLRVVRVSGVKAFRASRGGPEYLAARAALGAAGGAGAAAAAAPGPLPLLGAAALGEPRVVYSSAELMP